MRAAAGGRRLVRPRCGQVDAERQALAAGGGLEVGEQPVLPGACTGVQRDLPDAAGAQGGVHVLEAGQVPADHDQVQVLVVGRGVGGDRGAVGSEDPEPQRLRLRGRQLRRQRLQAVAVLGDLKPAGHLSRAVLRAGGVVGCV
ncbi:hypothetical protein ACFQY4_17795 [Catellatospora bangladeshensis]|uniref:hypothetical protein n=1 Tax=Catellatospora bangladeshensis TaxID=310355 RepID=UPI003617486D